VPWVPPACPHLPAADPALDARCLTAHGAARDGAFFRTALVYGHTLWRRGFAARAVLCLDRALGADLHGDEPELREAPLPYAALAWMLRHTPPGVFLGNPRVHYQHLADRMNEPRRDQRRWRAWAAWAITRRVRPEFPADPRHAVVEPTLPEIGARLDRHGLPGERDLWNSVWQSPPV